MTQKIIELARDAGVIATRIDGLERFYQAAYAAGVATEREAFAVHAVDIARRAVAEEREACALVAAWILKMPENDVSRSIRARGQQ